MNADGTTPALARKLFPQLGGRWGELRLDEVARDLMGLIGFPEKNPFVDAAYCEKWKLFLHKTMGVDYSWGGYLEDRAVVWRNHYHEPGHTVHLGVDFYVPEGTAVHLPVDATLAHVYVDPDQDGGWGGKLIFQWPKGYFVFGHLKDMVDDLGRGYREGKVVGTVADPASNGGWSPHLHFQCMRDFVPHVDGYTKRFDGIEAAFPNPLEQDWCSNKTGKGVRMKREEWYESRKFLLLRLVNNFVHDLSQTTQRLYDLTNLLNQEFDNGLTVCDKFTILERQLRLVQVESQRLIRAEAEFSHFVSPRRFDDDAGPVAAEGPA